jgi:uncharacterized DUF497 family protein
MLDIDTRHRRDILVGKVSGPTCRPGAIRIITARCVTRGERKLYEEG